MELRRRFRLVVAFRDHGIERFKCEVKGDDLSDALVVIGAADVVGIPPTPLDILARSVSRSSIAVPAMVTLLLDVSAGCDGRLAAKERRHVRLCLASAA